MTPVSGEKTPTTGARWGAASAMIATPAAAAALGRIAWETAAAVSVAPAIDTVVIAAVASIGSAACAWLTVVTVAVVITPGRWRPHVAAMAPRAWRRVLATALGIGVAAGGGLPAVADAPVGAGWVAATVTATDPDGEEPSAAGVASAGWVQEPSVTQTTAPGRGATTRIAHDPPPGEIRIVVSGDSLWTITADVLGTTDAATIAAAWPALHARNHDVIGTDPGLILPGQELELPEGWGR